jgi:ketosteroid isomerase-like protein
MATSDLERMLDDWAMAWSSAENNDPERVLALFADDCVFEDVTFGVNLGIKLVVFVQLSW